MKTYEVEYVKSAQKELLRLPSNVQRRILSRLKKLTLNPRIGDVRPMVGSKSWRLRIGDYRVVYDIHDTRLVILIIRVKHRRDVYRKK